MLRVLAFTAAAAFIFLQAAPASAIGGVCRADLQKIGERGLSRFVKYQFDFSKFDEFKKSYSEKETLDEETYAGIKIPEEKLAFLETLADRQNNPSYKVTEDNPDLQELIVLTHRFDFSKGITKAQVTRMANDLYMLQFNRLRSLKNYYEYRRDLGALRDEVKAKRAEAILFSHDILTALTEMGAIRSVQETSGLRRWLQNNMGLIQMVSHMAFRASLAYNLAFMFHVPLFFNTYAPFMGLSAIQPVEVSVGQAMERGSIPMRARVAIDMDSKEFSSIMRNVLVVVASVAIIHGVYHHEKYGGQDLVQNAHLENAVIKDSSLSMFDHAIAKHKEELRHEADPEKIKLIQSKINSIEHLKASFQNIPTDALPDSAPDLK